MRITPVLMLTHDDALWQHWRTLADTRWAPARGRTLDDLERWRAQERHLVMLDTALPRMPAWNSDEWTALLHKLQVVAASTRPNDEEGTQALGAGCCGYCHSYSPVHALSGVLEAVDAGAVWMGRSLVSRLLRLVDERTPSAAAWHADSLTDREQTVARRAARGEANSEIAEALGITERTVKAHLSSVFDKLKVNDRLQLALLVHGISQ